jgi:hypothetical protein
MRRARQFGAQDVRIGLCARAAAGLPSAVVGDGAFPGARRVPRGFLVAGLGAPINGSGIDSATVVSQR